MNKLNLYLFTNTIKYISINIILISLFVVFINLIEISRILDSQNQNIFNYIFLSLIKIPSIINESIPFIIIIAIAFLFRNLINNNELISMRNAGKSIFDIYAPIAIAIIFIGILILIILNPLSTTLEARFDKIVNKNLSSMYSIKIINNNMWIKNKINENEMNYFNLDNLDTSTMISKSIKILLINEKNNKILIADTGQIDEQKFNLNNVTIFDIDNEKYSIFDSFILNLNFSADNIIESISSYKYIPFYKYYSHIKNLEKFNLHSNEISLYYISEITKPLFLIILGFVVMGYAGKFKRNENFFKVLFISILIGFLFFILKELITYLSISLNLNFVFSYTIIFLLPFFIGLYLVNKIENN
tara:strand:+ start:6005 stop:7084 length:1080 start_codon:yes stop_codon:yes gene_type:complete